MWGLTAPRTRIHALEELEREVRDYFGALDDWVPELVPRVAEERRMRRAEDRIYELLDELEVCERPSRTA